MRRLVRATCTTAGTATRQAITGGEKLPHPIVVLDVAEKSHGSIRASGSKLVVEPARRSEGCGACHSTTMFWQTPIA